jgi:allantoinase
MRGMNHAAEHVDLSLVGHVLSSSVDLVRGEIQISSGKISAVNAIPAESGFRRRLDVGDAYLLPGLVDAHVHTLSDPAEGVAAATRSAAAGGVTTIVDMPFDAAGPISSVERFERKRQLVEAEALIDVAIMATVPPSADLEAVPDIARMGACGFKISTFETDPRRFPRLADAAMVDAFGAIAKSRLPVAVHAENNDIVKANIDREMRFGVEDPLAHCRARPWYAETSAVANVLEFAMATGVHLHLCHLSLARSVDLATRAKADGADVSVETCPHYLVFDESDISAQRGRLKMNPPLRTKADVAGLWDRVADGAIDVIASDHAPWRLEHKVHQNILENHSGLPGTETLLAVTADAARSHPRVALRRIVEAMSAVPARIYGLAHRKGDLCPGMDADVVVYDANLAASVDEARLHSNAGWSPYHGRALCGGVVQTYSRGEVVWADGSIRGAEGRGQWLPAIHDER